ncbi:MAG TPA: HAMP domain-containing protein [Bryobacteraceae bacterium]|nr:HAMP domain-containing protein [Bryobacteraceae bacterium]
MTLISFRNKLQFFSAVLSALLIAAGALGLAAQTGSAAQTAATVALAAAFALDVGLLWFANRYLGASSRALEAIQEAAQHIGRGEACPKITGALPGELNFIKDSLNSCAQELAGLAEVNQVLQRLSVNDHSTKVTGSYQGIFGEVARATNDTIDRIRAASLACNNVAKGDYEANLEKFKQVGRRSENDSFLPPFIGMMEAIDALVEDAQMLSAAAVNGDLSKRADVGRHRGEFKKVIQGINDTLDRVVEPLHTTAQALLQIAKGEIPQKITREAHGEFQSLNESLNSCSDGLSGLVEVNQVLQRVAVNDHSTKVAGKYLGIYGDVARATNDTIDRVRAASLACNNVAKGDYRANLEKFRQIGKRSDQDSFIPPFIEMMEAVDALVHDARMVSAAAVKGELSVRADENRHRGEYQKVIQGVNDTLDAITAPLHNAAGKLALIAKGEIPAKIVDAYQGEFDALKGNVNQAIVTLDSAAHVAEQISQGDLTVQAKTISEADVLGNALMQADR